MMDFSKILFRASANGDVMTAGSEVTDLQLKKIIEYEEKAKLKPLTDNQFAELQRLIHKRDNPTLGDTCTTRLIKMYAKALGREEEVRSKYMDKGTQVEQDSITLHSRAKKTVYFKNELELKDQWVSGTPDSGNHKQSILKATEILDYKSSWSLITFLKAKFGDLNSDYYWQGQTYLSLLPKAKSFRLIYCLVNSPAEIIFNEKKALKFKMYDVIDEDASPEYIDACKRIELSHIFDMPQFLETYPHFDFHSTPEEVEAWPNIPLEERYFETVIERNEEDINKLRAKIERCRIWMDQNFNHE